MALAFAIPFSAMTRIMSSTRALKWRPSAAPRPSGHDKPGIGQYFGAYADKIRHLAKYEMSDYGRIVAPALEIIANAKHDRPHDGADCWPRNSFISFISHIMLRHKVLVDAENTHYVGSISHASNLPSVAEAYQHCCGDRILRGAAL